MDEKTILENKRGREAAHTVAEFARLDSIGMSDGCRLRFWESLRDEIAKELPTPVVSSPRQMSEDEIRAFGRSVMRYGIHGGKVIDEVPIDYLEFISSESAEFMRKVRQYLNSPRIQSEREE